MDNDNYFKLVCTDISQNEKLNAFFKKLTRYSESEQLELISHDTNRVFVIKPNLKCVSDKIFELSNYWIRMNNCSELLKEENYLDDNISIMDIFNKVSFDDVHINDEHTSIFLDVISNKNNPNYIRPKSREELEYYEHSKENEEALLKAEKYKKKHGYERFLEDSKVPEKVLNLREVWNKNIELYKTCYKVQRLLDSEIHVEKIIELYNLVCETKIKYDGYSKALKNGQAFITEESNKIYSEALNSILENSMCEIDMDDIIENLFVILMYRKIKSESDNISSTTVFENFEFSFESVNWFLNFQSDRLNELYEELSQHLDIAVKAGIEKVLKK